MSQLGQVHAVGSTCRSGAIRRRLPGISMIGAFSRGGSMRREWVGASGQAA